MPDGDVFTYNLHKGWRDFARSLFLHPNDDGLLSRVMGPLRQDMREGTRANLDLVLKSIESVSSSSSAHAALREFNLEVSRRIGSVRDYRTQVAVRAGRRVVAGNFDMAGRPKGQQSVDPATALSITFLTVWSLAEVAPPGLTSQLAREEGISTEEALATLERTRKRLMVLPELRDLAVDLINVQSGVGLPRRRSTKKLPIDEIAHLAIGNL